MAYKHVRFDLRSKHYRRKKDYWRGVREGRIPPPKYKKPILTAIKLDPSNAILSQCSVDGLWLVGAHGQYCNFYPGPRSIMGCNRSVRGRRNAMHKPIDFDMQSHPS